jgi:predicted transcriptional regulator
MEGMTVAEIAKVLGLTPEAVRQRLSRAKLRPITKEAIYDPSVVDKIREAPMGRPPKAKPEEPARAGKKPETPASKKPAKTAKKPDK